MKLSVYYHIWAPFDEPLVRFLIDEQLKRLELHSLTNQASVNVVIVGKASREIAKYVDIYKMVNIRQIITEEHGWELHTLKVLQEDCKKDSNQYVMYMHTKGMQHYYNASRNPNFSSNTNTWRKILEYVCIDCWRECVSDLETHDAVSMNLFSSPFLHFSGNFWWARADHIIKLPDPMEVTDVSPVGPRALTPRHQAEAWIGKVKGNFHTRLQIPGSMYSTQKFSQYKMLIK